MGVHNEASRKWLRQEPVLLESLKTYFLCKTGFSTKVSFCLKTIFLAEPNLTTTSDQSNSCVLHASIIEAQSVQYKRTCELLLFYSHAEAQGSGCENGDPWCQSWIKFKAVRVLQYLQVGAICCGLSKNIIC